MKKFFKEQSAVTLIALIVTVIILSLLAGATISVMIKDDGMLSTSKQTALETEKEKFVEDAQTAYVSAYARKEDLENSTEVTLKDITSILMQDFGYKNRIVVEEGGSRISVRSNNIILEEDETKQLGLDLVVDANAFVKIKDKYYPMILNNGKVSLGNGLDDVDLSGGREYEITASSTDTSVVTVTSVNNSNLVIKAGKEGIANIIINYGSSSTSFKVYVSNVPVLANAHANVVVGTHTLKYGWDVFYEDTDHIYLLYQDYLENEAIPRSDDVVIDGSNIHGKDDKNDRKGVREKFQKYLEDTEKWKGFSEGMYMALTALGANINANSITTVGAMKITFFEKAYNDNNYKYVAYGRKLNLYTCPVNSKEGDSNFKGYYYRYEEDDTHELTFDTELRMGSHVKNDPVIFPHGTYEEKVDTGGKHLTEGYWLDANFYYDFNDSTYKDLDDKYIEERIKNSSSKNDRQDVVDDCTKEYKMIEMKYDGYMTRESIYDEDKYGLRPLVTIPNTSEIRNILGITTN